MDFIKPINDVVLYIETNITQEIDYEEIGKLFGRSISETQHVFAFVVGTTIGDYIRKRKLSKAYLDVLSTDEKIIDIAAKYQYDSHSAFSRAFVQHFLVSPMEVRRDKMVLKLYEPFRFNQDNNIYRRQVLDGTVRIVEIPNCKMVMSEPGMFGDGKLEAFDDWFSRFPEPTFPKDFLTYDPKKQGFVWFYIYDEEMNVPDSFKVIDFKGGLYLVSSGIDGEDDIIPKTAMTDFLAQSKELIYDDSRLQLGNVTTPKSAQEILGYSLMDYYMPIKKVNQ
ncbi:hypothetical protein BN85401980 [Alteracholeplasma palmae J233]|uniref:HTH araC/xylS-type domain-containing protein n=1 Tax=Alteracholeplasma palmae (strain ATCC 49389 / J233) TaxID=1318466 RepID=U4KNK3_ALTPJ|nr:AraC family transcriptional regulator [Alteracholeplasma palmae]CCV63775.1 hypothetical protein BN85401980 [Alteracholeplasma palmae J233]